MDNKSQNNRDNLVGCCFIMVIILFIILFLCRLIDTSFITKQVGQYPIMCSEDFNIYGECDSLKVPLNPTIFSVNADRQEVSYNSEILGIYKFENCVISNQYSWTCTYNDDSGTIGIVNGKFFDISNTENSAIIDLRKRTYYVTRNEYNWIKSDGNVLTYILLTLIP